MELIFNKMLVYMILTYIVKVGGYNSKYSLFKLIDFFIDNSIIQSTIIRL